MAEKKQRTIHICTCLECEQDLPGETAQLHASINFVLASLDEKSRRRFGGVLATQQGYGGVQHFARVTGLSRTTILGGQREIEQIDADQPGRIRAAGGGDQVIEKKLPPCSKHLMK